MLSRMCKCLRRPEEGSRFSGAGVTDTCEPLDAVLGPVLGSAGRAASARNC